MAHEMQYVHFVRPEPIRAEPSGAEEGGRPSRRKDNLSCCPKRLSALRRRRRRRPLRSLEACYDVCSSFLGLQRCTMSSRRVCVSQCVPRLHWEIVRSPYATPTQITCTLIRISTLSLIGQTAVRTAELTSSHSELLTAIGNIRGAAAAPHCLCRS